MCLHNALVPNTPSSVLITATILVPIVLPFTLFNFNFELLQTFFQRRSSSDIDTQERNLLMNKCSKSDMILFHIWNTHLYIVAGAFDYAEPV